MMQSESINELVGALSKAQGELTPALKDNVNPHFKSKYADLNSVWTACRAALSKHGLAVIQTMSMENGSYQLLTTLAHSSGQWMRSSMPILTQKMDSQGIGSAITYMRRYSLSAIVGIASDEDDDGNAACTPKSEPVAPPLVGREKAEELAALIDECDPVFQTKIWNFLAQGKLTRRTLGQMELGLYHKVFKQASLNRSQFIAKEEEPTDREENYA